MNTREWHVKLDPDQEILSMLEKEVISYGRAKAQVGEPLTIASYLYNEDGLFISGCSGRIEFNRLFINYLWTNKNYRHIGLGEQALERIQEKAFKQGSKDALIETLSDKTAEYYLRLGFKSIGVIKNYLPGFNKHTLLKKLDCKT